MSHYFHSQVSQGAERTLCGSHWTLQTPGWDRGHCADRLHSGTAQNESFTAEAQRRYCACVTPFNQMAFKHGYIQTHFRNIRPFSLEFGVIVYECIITPYRNNQNRFCCDFQPTTFYQISSYGWMKVCLAAFVV